MENLDKKFKQRVRMIKYFIDATIEIIEKEGYEGVTIRKVADIAGYNSATIYNYFDNLEHLLFFASMHYLQEYIDEIPNYISTAKDSREIYLMVWQCYIESSFKKPQIYYTIFFSNLKKDLELYVEQYYGYFPLDVKKYPKIVREMLMSKSISKRSLILMDACIEENIVSKDRAEIIDNLVICVYESMLLKVYRGSINASVANELVNNYIVEIFDRMK
ncbi:MAG: TetR/AcrR family transcriptional regulator [Peptoniphilaceae bacterium]|uniref:TetR/AcrR family transcriptional regulator n=1 Tax=Parvimonas sp. TaxID=1944660 RepID=UPI0025FA4662|nr:TetR/AcrR family transcriptional regulator [Parvimonas sp.]MCI5998043.1 TetR/AcrR family transcriptional regulator [Parvimonas sp.]MDD7764977.1 TetR/AcrR family transcriptional regulator [Peptoniphilaceae bacterium]MDY3050339.1 TetR/AcrR family transcriptional regulator [Parvimonas sp.]